MLSVLIAPVLAIPLVMALPTYTVPATLYESLLGGSTSDSCILPEGFTIEAFDIWTPGGTNNHSAMINFGYWDNSTKLQTFCTYNGSSVNVASPGYTPRYACENPTVEFIYQQSALTMIEKACPGSGAGYEASGTVSFNLTCVHTNPKSIFGAGKDCVSGETFVTADFTSLEPTPQ